MRELQNHACLSSPILPCSLLSSLSYSVFCLYFFNLPSTPSQVIRQTHRGILTDFLPPHGVISWLALLSQLLLSVARGILNTRALTKPLADPLTAWLLARRLLTNGALAGKWLT